MLDIMRRKKRLKAVLWVVIISLGLGMLLLFIPGQNVGIAGFDTSAATVAGEAISMKQYYDTYRRFVESYTAQSRNQIDPEMLKSLGLDRQALNALINTRVVIYAAKRLGLDVTPEEMRQALESNPNLQYQGKFIGVERYKALLAANQIDVAEFEDGLRSMLLSEKIKNVITDSLDLTEQQVREEFARQNIEAEVQYVLLKKDELKNKVSPSENDLRAYFDEHKSSYNISEKRRARYLLISTDAVASTLPVSEKEIDEQWQKSGQQETVNVSHILFEVKDPSKDAEVKAKAEAVLKQARAGEDFAALAKEYSDDTASAEQGGNLGSFPRGRMVKAFEDAAFSLKPGEISGLVRTQYGYHIIKVLSHDIPDKEKSRPALVRAVQIDKAAELVKRKALEAEKLAASQKDLEAAAKSLDVPATVQETPFLTKESDAYGSGISPAMIDEIFALKEIDATGKAVQIPAGYAVPKLVGLELPKPPDFEQSKEDVKRDYIDARAGELMKEEAQKLADDAAANGDLTVAARKAGFSLKTSTPFKQDASPAPEIGYAPEFNAQAFSLEVGGISKPVPLSGGAQTAVLQVKSRTAFDEAKYAEEKGKIRERVLSGLREIYFQDYIRRITDSLQKAGKIRINPQAIEQVAGSRY